MLINIKYIVNCNKIKLLCTNFVEIKKIINLRDYIKNIII
jgi:hypothetical protein